MFFKFTNSKNRVFDSSSYSNMQFDARNSDTSAIGRSRSRIEKTVGRVDQQSYSHDEVIDTVNNFSREFFSRLYEDADRVDNPVMNWESSAHDICDQLSEFDKLKSICDGDSDYSALATSQFLKDMRDKISDLISQDLDPDMVDYDDRLEDFRNYFRQSIGDITDDVGKTKTLVQSFQVGKSKDSDPEHRQQLIADISGNKSLADILELAGKLMDVANSLPVKSKELNEDITSVKLGRDIKRATNQSIAYLSDPQTDDMFFSKWIAHELEIYDMQGLKEIGRGPIRILLDVSGSMRADLAGNRWDNHKFDGVSRNQWAKAATIAMATIALKKKRQFTIQMFSTNIDETYRSNHKYDHNLMIKEVAEYVTPWGTSFDHLFDEVLPNLDEKEDILLITDGEDSISKEGLAAIEKARKDGLRIYTIMITENPSSTIEMISDQIVNLTSMINEDDISNAIAVTMDSIS